MLAAQFDKTHNVSYNAEYDTRDHCNDNENTYIGESTAAATFGRCPNKFEDVFNKSFQKRYKLRTTVTELCKQFVNHL